MTADSSEILSRLLRSRRSVRHFRPDPVPGEMLEAILADASASPSWSNTQPYRIGIATDALRDRLSREYCEAFDSEREPDGDFETAFPFPADLLPRRRATGFGLYKHLGIPREDMAARRRQMRRNFEFFGAPAVMFLFVHGGLGEYAVLDAGIFLQSIMLAAQARGLATCAQGALASWAGPPKRAFAVPADFKFVCGLSIGYASPEPVNAFNPGRAPIGELLVPPR